MRHWYVNSHLHIVGGNKKIAVNDLPKNAEIIPIHTMTFNIGHK